MGVRAFPEPLQQRNVVERGLAQRIGFRSTGLERWDRREVDAQAGVVERRRVLVAELAVVIFYAGDALRQIAALVAFGMDQREDGADQSLPPIFRQAGHDLGPPEAKRNALV